MPCKPRGIVFSKNTKKCSPLLFFQSYISSLSEFFLKKIKSSAINFRTFCPRVLGRKVVSPIKKLPEDSLFFLSFFVLDSNHPLPPSFSFPFSVFRVQLDFCIIVLDFMLTSCGDSLNRLYSVFLFAKIPFFPLYLFAGICPDFYPRVLFW